MRTLLAVLLLMTLAFAGCASNGGGGDGGQSSTQTSTKSGSQSGAVTSSQTTTGVSSTTTTGAPGQANRGPTGTMTAAVNGTTVAFLLNATDPDGDSLEWSLSFGDGTANATGTTLPANATHAYAQAGPFNATFTVTDGELSSSHFANLTLTAGAGGQAIIHSGSVAVPDPWAAALDGCLMDAGRRDAGGPGGVTGQDHPIEDTQWGWSYALDNPGLIAEYWSAAATILGSGTSGTVPADATYVVVCIKDPQAAPADYQLTLTPA